MLEDALADGETEPDAVRSALPEKEFYRLKGNCN